MRNMFHKGTIGVLASSVALILGVVSMSPVLAQEDMKRRSLNGEDDSFFFGGVICSMAF